MSPQPQAAVGAPLSRVDGRLKVTGQAKYAADHEPKGVVHAVVVDSSIGRGRITGIDTRAAEAQPGVLKVLHHRNAPKLPYGPNPGSLNLPGERLRVFQDDKVRFHGQPVAVVVATTLEAAQHAANLVKIDYDAERPATNLTDAPASGDPVTYTRGDAEAALRDAPVRLEMTYRPARNHHNAMELHATVARWEGERLTLWDKTQWVQSPRDELAANFGIRAKNIRVISPFVGGAFGNAARAWPHITIAALAAREAGRPVKLVLTRKQLYFGVGFRPSYEYKVRPWRSLRVPADSSDHAAQKTVGPTTRRNQDHGETLNRGTGHGLARQDHDRRVRRGTGHHHPLPRRSPLPPDSAHADRNCPPRPVDPRLLRQQRRAGRRPCIADALGVKPELRPTTVDAA